MDNLDLLVATQEAHRFLRRVQELEDCQKPLTLGEQLRDYGKKRHWHDGRGCLETAAVKRASLDLTRALSKLRGAGV